MPAKTTYAKIARDPLARASWEAALEMKSRGESARAILAVTAVKRSTFYYRLARERTLAYFMVQPLN